MYFLRQTERSIPTRGPGALRSVRRKPSAWRRTFGLSVSGSLQQRSRNGSATVVLYAWHAHTGSVRWRPHKAITERNLRSTGGFGRAYTYGLSADGRRYDVRLPLEGC